MRSEVARRTSCFPFPSLYYISTMNKHFAGCPFVFKLLHKRYRQKRHQRFSCGSDLQTACKHRVAHAVLGGWTKKYAKYEISGTSLSNIAHRSGPLCEMTHFLASGSGVRTRCSSCTAVLQSLAKLPREKTAALVPVSLSTSVTHNSAG